MIRKIKDIKSSRTVTIEMLYKIRDTFKDTQYFLLYFNKDINKYEILWIDDKCKDNLIFVSNLGIHNRNHVNLYNLDELILVHDEDIRKIHQGGKYVDPSSIQHILDEFYYTTNDVLAIKEV